MQDCFRLHPDVYGEELADPGPPEDDEPAIAGAVDAAVDGVAEDLPVSTIPASSNPPSTSSLPQTSAAPNSASRSSSSTPPPETLSSPTPSDSGVHPAHTTDDDDAEKSRRAKQATEQVKKDHDTGSQEELVPKEWHDTRPKNESRWIEITKKPREYTSEKSSILWD